MLLVGPLLAVSFSPSLAQDQLQSFSSSSGGCSIAIKSGPLVAALTGGAGPATASAKVFVKISDVATVKIDLSADPCFGAYSTTAGVSATTAGDTAVIVPLTNLANRQIYYYRVVINDCRVTTDCWPENDPSSSFLTPPADEITNVSSTDTYAFAFMSCSMNMQDQPTVSSPVFQALNNLLTNTATDDDPAIVFQIGDFDHRNPGMVNSAVSDATCNQPGQPLCNTNDWRAMHMDTRGPERLGVNQAGTEFKIYVQKHFAVEHIWDNHDFAGLDHFSGTGTQTFDNVADSGFLGRPNVLAAYLEYWPMHTLPTPPVCTSTMACTGGLYRTFTYGNVDFFVLDLRFQRADNQGTNATMLGSVQLAWLESALLSSQQQHPNRWRVIVSSLAFNYSAKTGAGSWGGFPTERNTVINYLNSNNIKNTVIVSGDLHSGGAIDYGQPFAGQSQSRNEISTPHMNINGANPPLKYDTGCGTTDQSGSWKMSAGAPNNYVSGAPLNTAGGCTLTTYPYGGPGYVLLRVDRVLGKLTLEVRDTNNVVRTNTTLNIPMSLVKNLGTD